MRERLSRAVPVDLRRPRHPHAGRRHEPRPDRLRRLSRPHVLGAGVRAVSVPRPAAIPPLDAPPDQQLADALGQCRHGSLRHPKTGLAVRFIERSHGTTQGHPTFADWPNYWMLLHQQMYVDWVYRAYRHGLRLMVMTITHSRTLCESFHRSSRCAVQRRRRDRGSDRCDAAHARRDRGARGRLDAPRPLVARGGRDHPREPARARARRRGRHAVRMRRRGRRALRARVVSRRRSIGCTGPASGRSRRSTWSTTASAAPRSSTIT